MRELFVSRGAEADVLEIWCCLFEKSARAADRVVDEITDTFDLLRAFPFAGRRRAEIGADWRSLAVGNYVVYYRVTDTRLLIARVLHGMRDVASILPVDDEDE